MKFISINFSKFENISCPKCEEPMTENIIRELLSGDEFEE